MDLRAIGNAAIVAGVVVTGACGQAPGAPTPPPPAPTYQTTVRVVSALNPQVGIPNVTVTIAGRPAQQTDANGVAVLLADSSGTWPLLLRHSAFLDRDTSVRVPRDGTSDLSLIPLTHDLAAFEEFAPRTAGLQRWTTHPRLLLLDHAVDYGGQTLGFHEFPVIDRRISQSQLDCLASAAATMLSDMSGNRLTWTSIDVAAVTPGTRYRTDLTPEGSIVILPAISLGAPGRGTAYVGTQAGVLTRGAVWFDVDTQNFCFTSLLYRHELGHALGYLHVTRTLSIMGPVGLPPSLTAFDRNSIDILFQRPPGNRPPDRDPSGFTVNAAAQDVRRGHEPLR